MKEYRSVRLITKIVGGLALATAAAIVPTLVAHADGSNLVANPSAETAASGMPASWTFDNWGTNTATSSWLGTGHTGTHSLGITVSALSSGDAKWMSAPIAVKPNTKYAASDWYIGSAATSLELMYTSTTNKTSFVWLADAPVSAAWKQLSATFTTPADAAKVSIYHVIAAKGTLQTDDFVLAESGNATPPPGSPTISMTAPAANATVSGSTVGLAATASADTVGVTFTVDDGQPIGTEDVAAPFAATWDSKTVTDGTHTISATARNAAGLKTTATVQVTVTNGTTTPPNPPASGPYSRGIVSLTFDDGWRNQYTNGVPLLQSHGMPATFYLLTSTITYPDYMSKAQFDALKAAGHEIASHTVTHPDLTTVGATKLDNELKNSQATLRGWYGPTVAKNFATPYGAYNSKVLTAIKKYYRSHRSTDDGFNTKADTDIYNIKVQNILDTTTPTQVGKWVDQAIRDKSWLVLVYHEVTAAAEDPTYAVTPTNLGKELDLIKQKGIAVETVDQALNELQK
jgi:peptidoglycan/xylan/chitin deacetylase (PgdA/CDA1 family)